MRLLPAWLSIWLVAALLAACAPVIAPPGPPVVAPALQDDAIVAADGYRLPLRRWLPEGEPRVVVLGLHGFGDYSRAFEKAALLWREQGVATYAYDQRGFGATATARRWAGVEAMIDDLAAAQTLVRRRHPTAKFVLMGESMGSALVMAALAGGHVPDPDATVLLGPAARGRETLGAVGRNGLWFIAHAIPWWPVSTVGMNYSPSDNIEMLRELSRDPLVIKSPRVDLVWGLVDAMDAALEAAPKLKGPMLVAYGARERVVPPAIMRNLVKRFPADPAIRFAVYDEGYHLLLRDLQAGRVQEDVLAWMLDAAVPLPSGADRRAVEFFAEEE
ncbi:MAG: alpha/beta fold hydrolase [Reyranellaceae bacterium]